jgi:tetratricopeptide (TPR) repeat protein
MKNLAVLSIFFLIALTVFGQQPKSASDYYEAARKSYQEKKFDSYVENLEQAIAAGANHPFLFYNLAGGYALLGKTDQSIEWLNKIADLGIVYPAGQSADFVSIRDTARFKEVLERFKKNLEPTNRSAVGLTLNDKDFIAEGVAYDPKSKSFFVSSVLKGKIVRIDRSGKQQDFAMIQDPKNAWAVLGMSADAKRGLLWAAISTIPEIANSKENAKSGVVKIDLNTGKVIKRYLIEDNSQAHLLGDVIVNQSGEAFATDSISPAVYRIANDQMEQFIGPELFRSPQGLCFSPDEKLLFVADYSRGIFAIDTKTKSDFRLSIPTATLAGIDGLYFYSNSLVATQNGFEPNRVLRIFLTPKLDQVERVQILESNHDRFDEITLGTIADGQLFYVGNGQLGKYLENKNAPLNPPIILKLRIE